METLRRRKNMFHQPISQITKQITEMGKHERESHDNKTQLMANDFPELANGTTAPCVNTKNTFPPFRVLVASHPFAYGEKKEKTRSLPIYLAVLCFFTIPHDCELRTQHTFLIASRRAVCVLCNPSIFQSIPGLALFPLCRVTRDTKNLYALCVCGALCAGMLLPQAVAIARI